VSTKASIKGGRTRPALRRLVFSAVEQALQRLEIPLPLEAWARFKEEMDRPAERGED
jgi:hypothetical protein